MEYLNDIIFNEASIYLGIIAIVMSVISLLTIIEQWILFNKLGEKGWKSLIPIYNKWVYLKLGDLPGWLILLPIANAIGLIVASFNIHKKLNKSTALGILYLISPNIYYLVLILGKTPSKSETNNIIENNINNNQESFGVPTDNNTSVEKIPEFIEQPALNTEEVIKPETTISNNAYINIEKEEPNKHADEDIINAFDIPLPEKTEDKTESLEMIDTLTKLKQSDIQEELTNQTSNNQDIEVLDQTVTTIDKDILEETVELPKMVNEEINSGLNVTKHCNNCGFENEYSQKNCLMCGAPLE